MTCKVCKFCILLYYEREIDTVRFLDSGAKCYFNEWLTRVNWRDFCQTVSCEKKLNIFYNVIESGLDHFLQHFATKLCNFTNFSTLFDAVVMNFTISIFLKNLSVMQSVPLQFQFLVCHLCNWSIVESWFYQN